MASLSLVEMAQVAMRMEECVEFSSFEIFDDFTFVAFTAFTFGPIK
jgi:hypothetical protein